MITITLPNGLTLSGTADQVTETAKKLGFAHLGDDGIHYMSESKGLIKIADMDTRHVRNAMLKLYREHVASLAQLSDKDLLRALRDGFDSKTFTSLLFHFARQVV